MRSLREERNCTTSMSWCSMQGTLYLACEEGGREGRVRKEGGRREEGGRRKGRTIA